LPESATSGLLFFLPAAGPGFLGPSRLLSFWPAARALLALRQKNYYYIKRENN
jgi:hypothetical protein